MASISCNEAASELLRQSIAGEHRDAALVPQLGTDACSHALFRILVEGLADRFEPRLCETYAAIFAQLLEQLSPEFQAGDLIARYHRVRQPRVCLLDPSHIVVLSRVTLGADIAITSVILEGLKRRFPHARIYLAGSAKASELFGADPRIEHLPTDYPRGGTLLERVATWRTLAAHLPGGDAVVVVDPDSRLTQLGLLPLGAESHYFFFESRSYGGDGDESLGQLAARWVASTFGVDPPQPHLAPHLLRVDMQHPAVTVSLGVGGNPAKSLSEGFEVDLIRRLCSRYADVIVDQGLGYAETARVQDAIRGTHARAFTGSFAAFASLIAKSDCYVGYDSVGQHAAAALGTPMVTLFKGFVSDRMFARWQPTGPGLKRVIKISGEEDPGELMASLDAFFSRIV